MKVTQKMRKYDEAHAALGFTGIWWEMRKEHNVFGFTGRFIFSIKCQSVKTRF